MLAACQRVWENCRPAAGQTGACSDERHTQRDHPVAPCPVRTTGPRSPRSARRRGAGRSRSRRGPRGRSSRSSRVRRRPAGPRARRGGRLRPPGPGSTGRGAPGPARPPRRGAGAAPAAAAGAGRRAEVDAAADPLDLEPGVAAAGQQGRELRVRAAPRRQAAARHPAPELDAGLRPLGGQVEEQPAPAHVHPQRPGSTSETPAGAGPAMAASAAPASARASVRVLSPPGRSRPEATRASSAG